MLNLPRVLAITTQDNTNSQKLLEKIGLKFQRLISLPGDAAQLKLFSSDS
jgi:RimJ/RimL family protein N-acetyltransferase